jgi:hypothetical protein
MKTMSIYFFKSHNIVCKQNTCKICLLLNASAFVKILNVQNYMKDVYKPSS